MPSTFFGLTIGKSGMYASQAAINTTAHNITNATTKGYSRQTISQSASTPVSVNSKFGMVGSGVDVNSIERERNLYLDEKYRSNNSLYGNYNAKEYYMTSIENYFSEVNSDGTTASFSNFYLALEDLARDVGNTTNRTAVSEMAESFTSYVNYLANGMKKIQEEANSDIKITVGRINALAAEIASLNKQINTIEMNGGFANDLRDSRDVILDELSTFANITVSEQKVGNGESGVTSCVVRLDGKILVDNYENKELIVTAREGSDNQCDMEGLYQIKWKDGQDFAMNSSTLGGKLQSLIEVRDGNNKEIFTGKTAAGTKGDTSITLTQANINNVNLLNIPAEDGTIVIDNREYTYKSFSVKVQNDGSYQYTFTGLKNYAGGDGLVSGVAAGTDIRIGQAIDYKGIPYYQAQLNEFVRTYTSAFNAIHNTGKDLYGNEGKDFFNAVMKSSDYNYDFDETLKAGTTFYSVPQKDTNGLVKLTQDGLISGSYYSMTALNVSISKSIMEDPKTLACSSNPKNENGEEINAGVEEKKILNELLALKEDFTMFKQGTPEAFLQSFTATIAVDTKQATVFTSSQKNILAAVDKQRMSISSVDTDEEAMNLVQYKQVYNLSCKVVQIMQELYDKLINGTAV